MTNTILCRASTGYINHPIQNLDMQYSLSKMTIFIQSFWFPSNGLFFFLLCSPNGYKIFSEALLIYSSFVRTPTENTILLWSAAAAAIQFHQHKCFTNTYTQSIGKKNNNKKHYFTQQEFLFSSVLVDCVNFYFHARTECPKMWMWLKYGVNQYFFYSFYLFVLISILQDRSRTWWT